MHDTIYYNGNILTMESSPHVQAVLVRDGSIFAAGNPEDLKNLADPDCTFRDLKGLTLMPSFIDSHSHFSAMANSRLQVSLEGAENFPEISRRIRNFIETQQIPRGNWVIGQGYDHNLLQEKTHPRRDLLDQAAPDHPVIIQHASGHVGVFNTFALRLLGVTSQTPCPSGGVLEQIDGQPSGYMEENAFIQYLRKAPALPSPEKLRQAFQEAQEVYASYGITTIQEGYFSSQLIPVYQDLLKANLLQLDVVAYPDYQELGKIQQEFPLCTDTYYRRLKIRGCKMFLDGSPQGRTAWMRKPYADDDSYRGYPTMNDAEVLAACRTALEHQVQLLAHCNGDAAAAQYLRCYGQALEIFRKSGGDEAVSRDLRPVIIHAQLLGPDQLDLLKQLGMIPSFFIAHIYHWGDIHLKNFGAERASHISPAGSAWRKQILFTFHQDSPVIPPDMAETLWCAVCRRTRNGVLLGADERIPVEEALKAVTIHAAWQYGEERTKGSIAVGKKADLIILNENPLTADPDRLRDLTVLETIKDGKTIFLR